MNNDLYTISFPNHLLLNDKECIIYNIMGINAGIGSYIRRITTYIPIIASVKDTCTMITSANDSMTEANGYSIPIQAAQNGISESDSNEIASCRDRSTHMFDTKSRSSLSRNAHNQAVTLQLPSPTVRKSHFLIRNTNKSLSNKHTAEPSTILLTDWYKRSTEGKNDDYALPLIDRCQWRMHPDALYSDTVINESLLEVIDNEALLKRRSIDIMQPTIIMSLSQLNNIAVSNTSYTDIAGIPLIIQLAARIDAVYLIPPSAKNSRWTVVHAWKEECDEQTARILKNTLLPLDVEFTSEYISKTISNRDVQSIHLGNLISLGYLIFDHTRLIETELSNINDVIINMLSHIDSSIDINSIDVDPSLVSFTGSMPPLVSPIPADEDMPIGVSIINPTRKLTSNELLKIYIANSGTSTSNLETRDDCISRLLEMSNDSPLTDILGHTLPCLTINLTRALTATDTEAAAADIKTIFSVLSRTSSGVTLTSDNGKIHNLKDLSLLDTNGKYKPIIPFVSCTMDNILDNTSAPDIYINVDNTNTVISDKPLSGLTFVVSGRYKGSEGFISQAQVKGNIIKSGGTIIKKPELLGNLTDDTSVFTNKCIAGQHTHEFYTVYTLDDLYYESELNKKTINEIINTCNDFKGFVVVIVNDEITAKNINEYTKNTNAKIAEQYIKMGQPIFIYNGIDNTEEDSEDKPTYISVHDGIDAMYHCIMAMTPDMINEVSEGKRKIEDIIPTAVKPDEMDLSKYVTIIYHHRQARYKSWRGLSPDGYKKAMEAILNRLSYIYS